MPLYTTVGTVVVWRDTSSVQPKIGYQFEYSIAEAAFFFQGGSIRVAQDGDPVFGFNSNAGKAAYVTDRFANYQPGTMVVGSLDTAYRNGLSAQTAIIGATSDQGYPDVTRVGVARASLSYTGTIRYSTISSVSMKDYAVGTYNSALTIEGMFTAARVLFWNNSVLTYNVQLAITPSAKATTPVDYLGDVLVYQPVNMENAGTNISFADQISVPQVLSASLAVTANTDTLDFLSAVAASDWLPLTPEPSVDRDQPYLLLQATTDSITPGPLKFPDLTRFGRLYSTTGTFVYGVQVQLENAGCTVMLVGDEVGFAGTTDGVSGWGLQAAMALSRMDRPVHYVSCCYAEVPFAMLMLNAVQDVKNFQPQVVMIPLWSNVDALAQSTINANIAKAMALGSMVESYGGVPVYYTPPPQILQCYNATLDFMRMSAWAAAARLARKGKSVLDLNRVLGDGQLPANYATNYYLDGNNPNPAGHVAAAGAAITLLSSIIG